VAAIAANPSLTAFFGPVFDSSIGGITTWRIGGFGALFTGLLSVMALLRHTRAEEESGRRELLGSTAIGRQAPLVAAVLTTLLAGLAIGVVAAAGLTVSGQPSAGAMAFGASFTMTGWVFAGLAAVAAQLTDSARSARIIALSVLGASYLIRMLADAADAAAWAVWVTPIGWAQRVRPFAGDAWSVVGLAVAVAAALLGFAVVLSARRDVGAGLLPTRLGPPSGPPGRGTPQALAWRLQRGVLMAWTVGFAAFGLVIGGITPGLADLVTTSPELSEIFDRLGGQRAITDGFLAAVIGFYALAAAGYAIQAALRLRTEELELRAELVLATATSRHGWVASHAAFALLGPVVLMAAAGVATALTYGLGVGDVWGQVARLVGASLSHLPAIWVLAGLTLALFGLRPRLVGLAWAVLTASFLITLLGAVLGLSQRLIDLSPFSHTPQLPGGPVSVVPLVWLVAVAAALAALGLGGAQRRDIG
jgi:ABC-2 type transport system permease protein